jgi:hypothetical protein
MNGILAKVTVVKRCIFQLCNKHEGYLEANDRRFYGVCGIASSIGAETLFAILLRMCLIVGSCISVTISGEPLVTIQAVL